MEANTGNEMDSSFILTIADELLDQILSHIDLRVDLINFACTSRVAASHIIPRHLEYRVLKIGSPSPALWDHLASRPDLALNVRAVAFTERRYSGEVALQRVPTSFTSDPHISHHENAEEQQSSNMIKAFRYMKNLQLFKCVRDQTPGLSPEQHTPDLLVAILGNKPNLSQLSVCGHFDRQNILCDMAKLENVDLNLSCLNMSLSRNSNESIQRKAINVYSWLHRSMSDLVYLGLSETEIDTRFGDLVIPSLKSFAITTETPVGNIICKFIEQNPTIEDLSWFPHDPAQFTPGILPNLKRLRSNQTFLRALEVAYHAAEPPVKYKVESFTAYFLPLKFILELDCLNRPSLKQISAGDQADFFFDVLKQMANDFPNIEVLKIPIGFCYGLSFNECYDLLPRFPNLQIVPFIPIDDPIDLNPNTEAIKEVIMRLARLCPKLQVLPAFGTSPSYGRRIVQLTRTPVDGQERIEFEFTETQRPNKTFEDYRALWRVDYMY
ncbi:hypothetical protein BDN72DRAFT_822156 [Pluteus cervinus]|uniref:Uncharacterized protein n=1 Tax=Pluteus cervinus TaxID=181527 RepID=A0ACD3AP16_9AGAR|nr:hypothetical protein BDN72DRAFT_822156 [Pluteus cervinus]